jgi:S-adenosylmethionine hydrolase
MSPIITLTTDFGLAGPYVAAMKGVILSINPAVRLVDLSHAVAPQDVRGAAILLAEATPWFPAGTLHLAVIDPGVGTRRKIIYAEIGDQRYIAPDNGLLSRLTSKTRPARIIALENSEHWLPSVSNTFHGRDIMAPVAAQLSLGMEPDRLGPPQAQMVELDWPAAQIRGNEIRGEVIWADGFGNLITNITSAMIAMVPGPRRARVEIAGGSLIGIAGTYEDSPADSLTALIGSSGYLEIAVVGGNAKERLIADLGAAVTIRWAREL